MVIKFSNFAANIKAPTLLQMRHLIMQIVIGLFIILLCHSSPLAQEQVKIISDKIDNLIQQGYSASNTSPDSGLIYGENAKYLSEQIEYTNGKISSSILLGGIWYSKGKYLKAISFYLQTAELSRAIGDVKSLSIAYERITYVLITLQQNEQAAFYSEQSLKYSAFEKDTSTLILIHYNLGLLAQNRNESVPALTNLLYGYYLACKSHNNEYAIRGLRLIGSFYISKKDFGYANSYYRLALKIAEKSGSVYELGTIYSHLAHTCKLQNEYGEALSLDLKAAETRITTGQKEQYISSVLNICDDYMILGHLDSAKAYLDKGLTLLPSENYYLRVYAYRLAKILALKTGDYQAALKAYENYSIANDSLNADKNKQEIAVIQVNERLFEIEQKNKLLKSQNAIQELQIKYNNRATALYLIVILAVLSLLAILSWLYIKTKRSRAALEALNVQLDHEIWERKQAETNLRISESSYRFLAENTLDVIMHMDARMRLIYVSPNCEQMLGYTGDELKSLFRPFIIIHPEYNEAMRGLYLDMINSGSPTIFTFETIRKNGERMWVECLSNPLYDSDNGKFSGSLTVIRNIAERVKYEEQLTASAKKNEMLLREIHHRVKNNFAILASVLTLQKVSAGNREMQTLVDDLQMRLRSMSLVHELLYKHNDLDYIPFDLYLMQLANVVAAAFRSKPVHIVPKTVPCTLHFKIALPLGLVVNELITNSFKYAFQEGGDGYLFITLEVREKDNSGNPLTWTLTVRDNGKGLPDGYEMDSTKTLGSQIVGMLVKQVEGSVKAIDGCGACFEIIFKQTID